ncbi:peroxidase-like isoform X1 [Metopolophium dirhodum]|uniref:peroxidase-like isoform X1 n=2 Tax=Metopolophium dirhodum TaxID=44670 RepID=UPI00298F8B7A|nr:peroxidase-like isoform X1 [Metopolophium dirhodum]
MEIVTVLLVLLVSLSCDCENLQNESDEPSAYTYGMPRKRGRNYVVKTNNIQGEETRYFTMSDDETVLDPYPSKIPSLMDPSKSIGFLHPQEISLADQCFPRPQCDFFYMYRTIDGSCNNLLYPTWGQTNTANTRIIQANYSDGYSELRKSVSGHELPEVRKIRKTIFKDIDKFSPKHNLFVMQYAQIISHDTTNTLLKETGPYGPVKCCNEDGSTPEILPKECLQIRIPHDEPESKYRCLSIPRSLDTSDKGCDIKPVRQIFGASSFIDASVLYGTDYETSRSIRTFKYGKLRRQLGPNGKLFLPNVKKATEFCNVTQDNTVCYLSGDPRTNITPDTVVATTSLMRLHNYLCDELSCLNPNWDDERIYQEARRILIAMHQHITYNELVPIILGRDFAKENYLLPMTNGFDDSYDQYLNPTTTTSFTGAAYRSMHSSIRGFIELVSEARKITSRIRISDFFFKPDIVQRQDNYDSFTRGLLTQHAQEVDQYFTEEISESAIRIPKRHRRVDLVSIDMARGRDYGEPSYNKFRKLCGLSEAKTFDSLIDQMDKKHVEALSKIYEHVDDIDYFVAGMLEKPKPGSLLGHTFQCDVGEMFFRYKYGDRYYYEFGNQIGSFKLEQLNEIRKTSLALIVCSTSDIYSVQRNMFEIPSSRNPLVTCNSLPKLDLSAWKED